MYFISDYRKSVKNWKVTKKFNRNWELQKKFIINYKKENLFIEWVKNVKKEIKELLKKTKRKIIKWNKKSKFLK